MRWVALVWGFFLGLAPLAAARPQPDAFGDWAASWSSPATGTPTRGGPSEAFDNARRDVAARSSEAGFQPANLRQYSVRPERYKDTRPEKSDPAAIYPTGLLRPDRQDAGGLHVLLSSHGSPAGAIVDDRILAARRARRHARQDLREPAHRRGDLGLLLRRLRAAPGPRQPHGADRRPAGPQLLRLRRGRQVPLLRRLLPSVDPRRPRFPGLGRAVQACVAAKEIETGAKPPSEPQLFVGGGLRPILPLLAFSSAPRVEASL